MTTEVLEQAPTDYSDLLVRLIAVQKEVGRIAATGKNQVGGRAISIADVENAVRDQFTEQGIVTVWSDEHVERYREATSKGEMTMFLIRCKVTLHCMDLPHVQIVAFSEDIGNSPASARSFARKAFYKALFHVAEEGDDAIHRPSYNGRESRGTSGDSPSPKQVEYLEKLLRDNGLHADISGLDKRGASDWIERLKADGTGARLAYPESHERAGEVVGRGTSNQPVTSVTNGTPDRLPQPSSPDQGASKNQLATIAKLVRVLGLSEDDWLVDGMSSEEAGAKITDLSQQYGERKKGGQTAAK